MKHLFVLALFIALSINAIVAQSTFAQNESLFVQEKIGTNFNQVSFEKDDIQFLFHQDRIELISDAEGEVSSFFVKINNVSFGMPEGDGMVNREVEAVNDPAMVKILGASTAEKSYFKTITYRDAKTGESVQVKIKDNEIEFLGSGDIPLELQLWGNAGQVTKRSETVQLERFGKTIKISSVNGPINQNANTLTLDKHAGKDNNKLNLSITIL